MMMMVDVLKVALGYQQHGFAVLSPVKLTLIKTKTQFFLSDQIVVIFRHGLVISFSGNELIREVHYSSTNLFL
ncbi:hypothetical protein F5J09_09640 [Lacticaseibacillus paracasei]|nr:hypothetical protein F5J09_09640 [Lacticaseibacillus paracasei]